MVIRLKTKGPQITDIFYLYLINYHKDTRVKTMTKYLHGGIFFVQMLLVFRSVFIIYWLIRMLFISSWMWRLIVCVLFLNKT